MLLCRASAKKLPYCLPPSHRIKMSATHVELMATPMVKMMRPGRSRWFCIMERNCRRRRSSVGADRSRIRSAFESARAVAVVLTKACPRERGRGIARARVRPHQQSVSGEGSVIVRVWLGTSVFIWGAIAANELLTNDLVRDLRGWPSCL